LRVGELRACLPAKAGYRFFRRFVHYHFAKQNNLPPYFFIKRLTAFSAKKELFWLSPAYNNQHLFRLYALPSLRFGAAPIRQLVIFSSLFNNTTTVTFFLSVFF
jgi:hypothetical protein